MPNLTDRPSLNRFRARAQNSGMATFLHEAVRDELQERLAEVNKSFTEIAIVSGLPDLWAKYWPDAHHVLDTDVLDLPVGSFDLVVHTMGMHWADDPVGQMVQSRRALKPDGLFLGAMLGGETLSELRQVMTDVEIQQTGGLSPRVAPMAEIRDLGGLIQRAGLTMPVADSLPLTVSYESAMHLIRDLRAMGEVNALAGRHRAPLPRRFFPQVVADYAQRFGDGNGRVTATFELIFLTGWAPDDSQPKPLRPGSATTRLSEALGTTEHGMFNKPQEDSD
jgi:SAM-dependent methyltransferase